MKSRIQKIHNYGDALPKLSIKTLLEQHRNTEHNQRKSITGKDDPRVQASEEACFVIQPLTIGKERMADSLWGFIWMVGSKLEHAYPTSNNFHQEICLFLLWRKVVSVSKLTCHSSFQRELHHQPCWVDPSASAQLGRKPRLSPENLPFVHGAT